VDCIDFPDRTVCRETQDRWTRITDFGLSPGTFEEGVSPVGQMTELFEGLALLFTWTDSKGLKQQRSCELSIFNREGDGRSLLIRLEDQEKCGVFSESRGHTPMLHLVNHISKPVSYRAGRDVSQWDGKVLEAAIHRIFVPEVGLAASVMIRGYGFGVSQ
jgi:hypothetical protein